MTTAVYVRMSRDHTGEGAGVERQRQDCLRLCESRSLADVTIYNDNDVSASVKKPRPAYQRMLTDIRNGMVSTVVAFHVDRLTRRLVELEELIDLAAQHDLKVLTSSGDLDLTTDAGRLNGRILASVARGEVERKSSRQRRASLQLAEDGRPPVRRAFGYTPDGMKPLEPEATAVRDLYGKALTGSTLISLAEWLNVQGLTNTRGDRWQRGAVRALLLNPRYKGTRLYQGAEVGTGTWEPLVSEETWHAVRAHLENPGRKSNVEGTARKWLGSGLFLCGRCPEDDRSDVRVNYREGKVRIYRCRRHLHLSRVADPIDELVSAVIVARLRRPDLADLLDATSGTPDGRPLADVRREATGLRARMDSLGVELAEGVLTARQVQIATQRLTLKLKACEDELAKAGRTSVLHAIGAAPDPGAAWLASDLHEQRAVIDTLARVVLLPGTAGRTPLDPASVLIEPKVQA